MDDAQRLTLETLKLLLQMAMADGTLADEETVRLLSIARNLDAPQEFATYLAQCAKGQLAPSPDLALLRKNKAETLSLAREMAQADGVVTEEEEDFLEVVSALLG